MYIVCILFNTQCVMYIVHCKRNIISISGVCATGTLGFDSWNAQDIVFKVILPSYVRYYVET